MIGVTTNRPRPGANMASTSSLGAQRRFDPHFQPEHNSSILSFVTRQDLSDLRPLLQTACSRIMDLVANWHQLYKMQYRGRRSLSEAEFQQLFGISLLKSTRSLLDHRIEDYAA